MDDKLRTTILNFLGDKCFIPDEFCEETAIQLYDEINKAGFKIVEE